MTPERFMELSRRVADPDWCGDGVHRELLDALAAERWHATTLQARLDAAEAGIAAETDRALAEWDATASSHAEGKFDGLEIAARIVGES